MRIVIAGACTITTIFALDVLGTWWPMARVQSLTDALLLLIFNWLVIGDGE